LRHERCGRDDGVLFLGEKIEEAITDLRGGHGASREVGQSRFLSKADNLPMNRVETANHGISQLLGNS
jgi:hypothetical protein